MKVLLLLLVPALLFSQAQFRKVDPTLTHERIVALVPMVGSGTGKDPKRPMFSDLPGLLGYTAELSDDGRLALVEFVVKDRSLLDRVMSGAQRAVRKDSASKDSIYEEFKQLKRNFRPERFGVAIP